MGNGLRCDSCGAEFRALKWYEGLSRYLCRRCYHETMLSRQVVALRAELLERAIAHEEAVDAAEYWQARHHDMVIELCAAEVGEIWLGSEGRREFRERAEILDAVVKAARDVELDWQESPHMIVSEAKMVKLIDALRALEPEVGDE